LHDVHCAPPVPHADMPGVVTQTLPLQQPFGQDCALQTHCPPLHARPVPHVIQALPAAPQLVLLAVWQTPLPSQQPSGQDCGVQTHLPCALHSCVI
jgi:hypothetical protein